MKDIDNVIEYYKKRIQRLIDNKARGITSSIYYLMTYFKVIVN